ncbi:unnamed protein product, partial [Polarella glacialis]
MAPRLPRQSSKARAPTDPAFHQCLQLLLSSSLLLLWSFLLLLLLLLLFVLLFFVVANNSNNTMWGIRKPKAALPLVDAHKDHFESRDETKSFVFVVIVVVVYVVVVVVVVV